MLFDEFHERSLDADLALVASFHGLLETDRPADRPIRARILVCHGDADALVPRDHVMRFWEEMDAVGANWHFHSYSGVRHGFTDPGSDTRGFDAVKYNASADRQSWAAMLGLFDEVFAADADLLSSAIAFANKIADVRPLPRVRDRKVDYPNHEAFLQFSRNTVKVMAGPFPAPLECVETIAASVTKKFDDGLAFERERFLHLIQTPESKSLRHAFFAERAAAKIADQGLLVIHDAFINEAKNGPIHVAEYSALLMHSTQGKCYSTGEYAALAEEAGFTAGPYQDTAAARGFMTAVKR